MAHYLNSAINLKLKSIAERDFSLSVDDDQLHSIDRWEDKRWMVSGFV